MTGPISPPDAAARGERRLGAALGWFRAVALDFDGTLTDGGRPAPEVLSVLEATRAAGVRVVLVTGRILSELRAVFPDVDSYVDAIVGENGAVLARSFGTTTLAPPVDPALGVGLARRRIAFRKGRVVIACGAADETAVFEEVHRLGLDCHLLRNRSELMVLPAGVTKGTGLFEALGDLGLSHHNTIGVGDAENDHSLLEVCEVGVAVGNAIPSLCEHADLVLSRPDGSGVTALLQGGLLAGREHVYPLRWQITLGEDDAGQPVRLPASQLNVSWPGARVTGSPTSPA